MNEQKFRNPLHLLSQTMAEPGPRNYLFLTSACLLLNFFLMSSQGAELIGLFALLFAIPGILASWSSSLYLYVIIIGYHLFDPGLRIAAQNFNSRSFGLPGMPRLERILLALGTLGYVMGQLKLLGFWRFLLPPRFRNRGEAIELTEGPIVRKAEDCPPTETGDSIFQVLICGVLAVVLCNALYNSGLWLNEKRFITLEANLASLALFVGLIAAILLVLYLLFLIMDRRKTTQDEAYLTLADEFWKSSRREQQRMDRWIKWYKRKQMRKGENLP
ncbi:hypothetical protein KIH39_03215 [Telmatocola sphagniphila]|uniref:Uncharacterized protein n=1 Tax=Telmatocola sphagniphila TaxID=1123043 RepID=A0A8E6B734_9BACT|nr:hypothetical protein [Telmatocola sphagniphila]QVL32941.1 hypothetical protein KIH39_03215 [Telmatocola sphagniphila]